MGKSVASTGSKQTMKPGKTISTEMMLKSVNLARRKIESNQEFLARVTHLHLQAKNINEVSNLEGCSNLKVLYLYDNQLAEIPNLEFAKILAYLYLQNNFITKMPVMQIPNLKKLYLDENQIEFLTGLENCTILEELFLGRQRLPRFTPLEFDVSSLQAVAETLQVIDVSGNQVESLMPLQCLIKLRRVFAQDNNVSSIADIEAVVSLPKIEEANFSNNPICKVPRYRDAAIAAASDRLMLFDDVEVLKHQQIATRGLQEHRRKIGVSFPLQENFNQESLFGDDVDGEAVNVQYSEADDLAFGSRPDNSLEGTQ